MNAIATRLICARKITGHTQTELGSLTGLSRDIIVSMERGRTNLRLVNAFKICRVLNINPLWLASGEGPMSPFQESNLQATPIPPSRRILRRMQRLSRRRSRRELIISALMNGRSDSWIRLLTEILLTSRDKQVVTKIPRMCFKVTYWRKRLGLPLRKRGAKPKSRTSKYMLRKYGPPSPLLPTKSIP